VTKAPRNVVASVLARLRNVAQEAGLSFNDILQSYVIERFLSRLSRSPHADTVLLKGALMLRVWGVPRARPTMDIDLLRRALPIRQRSYGSSNSARQLAILLTVSSSSRRRSSHRTSNLI